MNRRRFVSMFTDGTAYDAFADLVDTVFHHRHVAADPDAVVAAAVAAVDTARTSNLYGARADTVVIDAGADTVEGLRYKARRMFDLHERMRVAIMDIVDNDHDMPRMVTDPDPDTLRLVWSMSMDDTGTVMLTATDMDTGVTLARPARTYEQRWCRDIRNEMESSGTASVADDARVGGESGANGNDNGGPL